MTDAPVVFGSSVEALARVVGPKLTPALKARYAALGFDLGRPHPAYPYDAWVKALELTLSELYPGEPEERATFLLGRALFESYGTTMIGRALMQMLKVLGPRRALHRMARNLRTTNNYSDSRLTEQGERHAELWINKARFPEYFRGLLCAGLEFTGAREVQVTVKERGALPDESVVFDVRWS